MSEKSGSDGMSQRFKLTHGVPLLQDIFWHRYREPNRTKMPLTASQKAGIVELDLVVKATPLAPQDSIEIVENALRGMGDKARDIEREFPKSVFLGLPYHVFLRDDVPKFPILTPQDIVKGVELADENTKDLALKQAVRLLEVNMFMTRVLRQGDVTVFRRGYAKNPYTYGAKIKAPEEIAEYEYMANRTLPPVISWWQTLSSEWNLETTPVYREKEEEKTLFVSSVSTLMNQGLIFPDILDDGSLVFCDEKPELVAPDSTVTSQ